MKLMSRFAGPLGLAILFSLLVSCGPQPKEQAESTEEEAVEEEVVETLAEEAAPQATLVIMHQVEDFDVWKAAFDEHKAMREGAGLIDFGVWRQEENPNVIAVAAGCTDMAKAVEFVGSEGLKSAMQGAGVVGEPQMTYIKGEMVIEGESPSENYLSVTHEVADYAVWKEAFDKDAEAREGSGLVLRSLSRNLDNANEVWVLFAVTDRAATDMFIGSPELAKAMEEAGVVGEPQITYWSRVVTDAM